MAFLELNVYSEALGMQTQVYVCMPQKNNRGEIGIGNAETDKPKCLYLLHGLSDDHTIWLRRTSIDRYAQNNGLCVIMPDGARSFYTDMRHGGKYYTYIAEELPRILSGLLNISTKKEDTFIAGLSMGGYGALKIGLKNPDRFAKIGALSSVCDVSWVRHAHPMDADAIFGADAPAPKEDDLFYLAENCKERPEIFMACGTEDFLYKANQSFREHLEALGYDFEYYESHGAHTWEFWDENIQRIIAFLLK